MRRFLIYAIMPELRTLLTYIAVVAAALMMCLPAKAQQTPLAKGRWLKVRVEAEGPVCITREMLASRGFDDIADVRVVGFGSVRCAHSLGALPEELPQVAVKRTTEAIYFYAEGDSLVLPTAEGIEIHENFYSRCSYYFVGVETGLPDLLIDYAPDVPSATDRCTDTFMAVDFRPGRDTMLGEGGVLFHTRSATSAPLHYTFDATDITGTPRFGFIAAADPDRSGGIEVSAHGQSIVASDFNTVVDEHTLYVETAPHEWALPVLAPSPARAIEVDVTPAPGADFDYLGLRYAYLKAPRRCRLHPAGSVMRFASDSVTAVSILSTTPADVSEAEVWDVSNPSRPVRCQTATASPSTLIASLPASSAPLRTLCAFSPGDSVRHATIVGTIDQTALVEATRLSGLEMLIISTDTLLGEARRLADAHERWQEMKTDVVSCRTIFDLIGSGASHPAALRTFIRRLRSMSSPDLRYVCLMGLASRDPRNFLSDDPGERLPCYQVESCEEARYEVASHTSDSYFGMVFADETVPEQLSAATGVDIAVGRIPAADVAEAAAYVDKAIALLADPSLGGDPSQWLLFGCKGDASYHLSQCELIASDIATRVPGSIVVKAYPNLYAASSKTDGPVEGVRTRLYSTLAGRPSFYGYMGHASLNAISYSNHLLSDERRLHYGSMPIAFLAGCHTYPIDFEGASMGRAALMRPSGPAVLIGAGRKVITNRCSTIMRLFVLSLATADPSDRIGDIWRNTVAASLRQSAALRQAMLLFNFAGDPALPSPVAAARVSLSMPDSGATLAADSIVTLSGSITAPDGTPLSDFNGRMELRFYEPPHTARTLIHSSGEKRLDVSLQQDLCQTAAAEVRAGHWSVTLPLPYPTRDGLTRLTFEAGDTFSHTRASGFADLDIRPAAIAAAPLSADTIAPDISIRLDGAPVSHAPYPAAPELSISLSDTLSGIRFNPSQAGAVPSVSIDGHFVAHLSSLWRPVADGGLEMNLPLEHIAEGTHTISVRASDRSGNTSTAEATFILSRPALRGALAPLPMIVRSDVEFDLSNLSTSMPVTGRLIVTDLRGETVFTAANLSLPFAWSLCATDGTPLPNGPYRARYLFTDGLRHAATPEIKFHILRLPK